MKRGRPLRANPDKTREWQDRSRRNQMLDTDERAVREAVFARDGYRCLLRDHVGELVPDPDDGTIVEVPRCYGPLTFHHRRKAGAAGAYVEANGATTCLTHNVWIEDEPEAAKAVLPFLVVREGDPEWDQLGARAARHAP